MFPILKMSLIEASQCTGTHQEQANSYFFALLPFCQIIQNELMKISTAMPEDFPKEFFSLETQSSCFFQREKQNWYPLCNDNENLYFSFEKPEETINLIVNFIEKGNFNNPVKIPEIVIESFKTICGISQIFQEVSAPNGNLSTMKITSNSIHISIEVQDEEGEGNVNFHSNN